MNCAVAFSTQMSFKFMAMGKIRTAISAL
jgi:hypothetical protein